MEYLRPGYRKTAWFGPVHRRLSAVPGYREAVVLAAELAPNRAAPPGGALGGQREVPTTPRPRLFFETTPIRDPRFSFGRLFPGDAKTWKLWTRLFRPRTRPEEPTATRPRP